MILKDLLGVIESRTLINLYVSKNPLWNANDEKMIMRECYPVHIITQLDEKRKNSNIIGVKVDCDNLYSDDITLHICIFEA